MKSLILVFLLLLIQNITNVTYDQALDNLSILESYIKEYKTEKKSSKTLNHLILSYIREGVYNSNAWRIAGGSSPSDLHQYILDKDAEKNTNAVAVRSYKEIELPSKEKTDFVHLFAVMNGIDFGKSYTDGYSALCGWGGDTEQLLEDIKDEKGTLDELVNIALTNYLGIKGKFGPADLVADLDAPIILKKKNDDITFASIIKDYYEKGEYKNRVSDFAKITFPNIKKEDLRTKVYERYTSDSYIDVLECQAEVRDSGIFGCIFPGNIKTQYKNHQRAATYAFADYLASHC